MRLGTWYRKHTLGAVGVQASGRCALEVGCYDGLLLSGLPFGVRVGVDLEPAPRALVLMVRADGCALPFPDATFDVVLALDVLEHVAVDSDLLLSMLRVLRPGGTLWLSTPSDRFRITPGWANAWLQKRWGHLRVGYSAEQIRRRLPAGCQAEIIQWDEPYFRLLWVPLRILWAAARPLARRLVAMVAGWDAARAAGDNGHYYVRVRREPGSDQTQGGLV